MGAHASRLHSSENERNSFTVQARHPRFHVFLIDFNKIDFHGSSIANH